MHNSKKSNTGSAKTSLLLVACAMAVIFFMILFTVISPTTAQTAPAAVVLPTGQWEIHKNGYIGTLTIDNVGADGVVTGRLEVPPDPPDAINGFYNETTGNLTFYRIINQQDRSSNETYAGIVFRDGSPFAGTPDRMAGYFCIACEFIGLPPAGEGNQEQNIWGWYAILKSTSTQGTANTPPSSLRPGGGTVTAPAPTTPGGGGGTTAPPPTTGGAAGGGTPTTPGGSGSGAGGITATLSANPPIHEGPCPAAIRFTGTITDNVGNRDVIYRFIRNDGAILSQQVIHFNEPGSQSVSLGPPNTPPWESQGWYAIEILQPVQLQSNRAAFEVRCIATPPPPGDGPPTPPPPPPGDGPPTPPPSGGGDNAMGGDPTVDTSPPPTIEGNGGGGNGGDPTVDATPPGTFEGNTAAEEEGGQRP
jgi:hypothetical protein